MSKPRILIPEPTSTDPEYNQRGWRQYAAAVEQAGGIPVPIPLHASQEEQAQLIAGAQAVLLPGSHADVNPEKWNEPLHPKAAPCDPLREAADELLLQDAFNLQKPIFGVCERTTIDAESGDHASEPPEIGPSEICATSGHHQAPPVPLGHRP